ncbi:MAG: RluA family pseudouridine synthase [Polyangiaceae bacterium]|nr:RluA family pseudouridine synthase [Polyangiaceae bacterium]MCE7893726.1 RluA family pseudouridine synthase [Sorangiineae bacterium PRO1]MCL4754692.1 RluA family pseudouridine synthase [Myxococcales bacterium]
MRRFQIDAELSGERVDKLLARLLPGTSRATIQRWIGEGRVRIDGRPCRARDTPGEGSTVEVEPGPPPPSEALPDPSVPYRVVFEDAHLIVVDKPAGVVVHPARGHRDGTLVSGLLSREGFGGAPADPRDPAGPLRPGIVHRIDKDTSGILVVAKDEATREGLKAQLARHDVEREYRALTLGVPRAGRVETLHGRDPKSRLRFTTRVREGRRAVTLVSVLEVLSGGRAALVACRLETGRTHQIRVHLAEQTKTPILADALYGRRSQDPELRAVELALGRQALHAALLGFVHPVSGATLRFESPLPEDMQRALERLRALG